MKTKFKQCLMLFATFFKIGLFTFGGGYAMISLIETETVERKKWIVGPDLLNIIACRIYAGTYSYKLGNLYRI